MSRGLSNGLEPTQHFFARKFVLAVRRPSQGAQRKPSNIFLGAKIRLVEDQTFHSDGKKMNSVSPLKNLNSVPPVKNFDASGSGFVVSQGTTKEGGGNPNDFSLMSKISDSGDAPSQGKDFEQGLGFKKPVPQGEGILDPQKKEEFSNILKLMQSNEPELGLPRVGRYAGPSKSELRMSSSAILNFHSGKKKPPIGPMGTDSWLKDGGSMIKSHTRNNSSKHSNFPYNIDQNDSN
jgi:hypothetical protein